LRKPEPNLPSFFEGDEVFSNEVSCTLRIGSLLEVGADRASGRHELAGKPGHEVPAFGHDAAECNDVAREHERTFPNVIRLVHSAQRPATVPIEYPRGFAHVGPY